MWIRSAGDSSSVYEYNITVSPFTYSYNRTITNIPSSAGLCAINNTTLIGISNYSVYSCDITTNTSVNTFKFNFANTSRRVSGDYILTTDGHFIVLTYAASGPPNNYIEQYNWSTGVQEVEVLLSSTYRPYGLYEYDDGITG